MVIELPAPNSNVMCAFLAHWNNEVHPMKIQKIMLSLLLCFALLWAAPMAYAADSEIYTDNYLQYTIENGSITIVNYYGEDAEVTVPASIGAYPVNTIAAGAFADCENVTKINLPDCIMTVEQGAFSGAQTVVFDSNTDEPIAREPDVEREQQEQSEAQNPGQSAVQNPGTSNQPASPTESEPVEVIADFGEGEGDMVGVIVNPADGSSATTGENAGANNSSQQGNKNNQTNAAKSGMPWYGVAAIVAGVAVLAGGGYFLWRKKHGTN